MCTCTCGLVFLYSVLLFFPLSVLAVLLLHVHHAGGHDRMVPGLAAVGHPGGGRRRPAWMAILRSGRVGDSNACLAPICFLRRYWAEVDPPFFSRRLPIAVDLLVLKRQWRSFMLWSVLALLLLLVRISFWKNAHKGNIVPL